MTNVVWTSRPQAKAGSRCRVSVLPSPAGQKQDKRVDIERIHGDIAVDVCPASRAALASDGAIALFTDHRADGSAMKALHAVLVEFAGGFLAVGWYVLSPERTYSDQLSSFVLASRVERETGVFS
jgi:hypothetical protein